MTPAELVGQASVRRRLMERVRGPWQDATLTEADCWDWTGRWRSRFGYGRLRAAGHNGRPLQAHLVMYLLERGAFPEGLILDHRCRRPICCNPWHLEPVTIAVNNRRRYWPAPTLDARAVEDYAEWCELEAGIYACLEVK